MQQPTRQRLAEVQQQLDRLGRLQQPHHARQDAQDTGFGAIGRGLRRRRFREQAAVARRLAATAPGVEHACLPLEPVDRAVDERLAQVHAGVVEQVPRGKVVGAIDDHVGIRDEPFDIVGTDALAEWFDADRRVQGRQGDARRFHLRHAHARIAVQDLALQVAAVHDVVIGQHDRADAGGGQVIGGRRP